MGNLNGAFVGNAREYFRYREEGQDLPRPLRRPRRPRLAGEEEGGLSERQNLLRAPDEIWKLKKDCYP